MKRMYYFAYGSNCNLTQMAHRCPLAIKAGMATLHNYKLTFNSKRNGTGVANIHRSNGSDVQGLLWEITPECEMSLDRYEGYPYLYEKKNVTVQTESGERISAMVYVMTSSHREPAMPDSGYLQGIIVGFKQNMMDSGSVLAAVEDTKMQCKIKHRRTVE